MTETLTIPRSGSCRESDPDYDPLIVRFGLRFDVLLNGERVSHVIAYDCDEGWVRALKVRGGPGLERPFIENGKAAEHTVRGDVSVRWR